MHSLVVCLFKEGFYPAWCEELGFVVQWLVEYSPSIVSAHSAYAFEVPEHPCYHAWDASYAFEEHESCDPFLFGHDLGR